MAKVQELLQGEGITLSESDPDIVRIIPGADDLNLGIDTVRTLTNSLALQPIMHKTKVAIIEQAHLLTEQAQNALLKTLEEPPADAKIFLLAQGPDLFLPTILSRCRLIELSPDIQVTAEDKASLTNQLTMIANADLGHRLHLATDIASDRQSALAWLDQVLLVLHASKSFDHIRRILTAKKYLQAGTNVRLTLENLTLNW